MGAVSFSIDERLVQRLRQALPLEVFVETGTFHGDSLAAALAWAKRAVSIEFSRPLWQAARERFAGDPRVEVLHGDSAELLARVRPALGESSALYWLDAHWCVAAGTAGENSQCPLLRELAAIGTLGDTSAILIDDARLFLAPPPEPHEVSDWPSFDAILGALRRVAPRHQVMVVNDVIAVYPPAAGAAVAAYAREHGVDWLRAAQSLEENHELRSELDARQVVITKLAEGLQGARGDLSQHAHQLEARHADVRRLEGALGEAQESTARAQRELEGKERVIHELDRALTAYRAAFGMARPLLPLVRGALRLVRTGVHSFRPKLGLLHQHAPFELRVPADYARVAPPDPAPRISLVTPSFRQAAFIEATLESVLAQGYPNLEYRVQDGGSNDGTVAILERYAPRLAGWESRPDAGQANAINLAFAHTDGEIMGWLNSDDLLLPGSLAAVASHFARHPDVDVVYGHRIIVDEHGREIGRWIMPTHDGSVLSWADYVPQETLFWRRRIWERAGGRVDESFRFAMDWDLLVRFRKAGARFARIPRFLGAFRVHSAQKTTAEIADVGFAEMNRVRLAALGRVPTYKEIRRAVLPYLLRHAAIDARWRIARRLGWTS